VEGVKTLIRQVIGEMTFNPSPNGPREEEDKASAAKVEAVEEDNNFP